MRIEDTVLTHLLYNEAYTRKVIPFIKPEFFEDFAEKLVFEDIYAFVNKYNSLPTVEALSISLDDKIGLTDETYKSAKEILSKFKKPEPVADEWLGSQTEKWCQDRSIYLAIMESIAIIGGKTDKTKEALPELLKEALAVSFDTNLGHDYLEDADKRYEFYHTTASKIPFHLETLNKATNGGLEPKTLSILLAGIHVGKTLVMCDLSAGHLMQGDDVLYVTLEMAEEKIAERIDANLMNIMMDDLRSIPKSTFDQKIEKLRKKTVGKLIVREFPTASFHVGHLRNLLRELELKKKFKPKIVYVDYLNLMLSSRLKFGNNINSYTYIKFIAEELRGLASEKKLAIVSATQVTRPAFGSSDLGMDDTSESFALPAIADFMVAIITSDELKELDQLLFKQLKNRFKNLEDMTKFVMGVDKSRMRLYDVEQSAQDGIIQEKPVMDKTKFGERRKEEEQMPWKTKTKGKRDFSGLRT